MEAASRGVNRRSLPHIHALVTRDLAPLMQPTSIGVVGASPRMGRSTRVIANLQRFGYGGRIVPINPKHTEVLGLPRYPDLSSTPEPVDVIVVAFPPSTCSPW